MPSALYAHLGQDRVATAAALGRISSSAALLDILVTSGRRRAEPTPQARLGSGSAPVGDLLYRVPDQPSLDGNTVNMDVERTRFADNSVRYQAALTMLNVRIQGLKSAMQPEYELNHVDVFDF